MPIYSVNNPSNDVSLMNENEMNQLLLRKILRQLKIDPEEHEVKHTPRNILMISAEYLPKDLTPQSLHCKSLADGLVDRNMNVNVISYDPWKAGQTVEMGGVKVHYVNNPIKTYSPLTWALTLAMEINRTAADIFHREGGIDLIHAHQWEMFPCGLSLQAAINKPLIVNYYSLQHHRAPGVSNGYTDSVKQIEWRGSKDSQKVMVNEDWLKNEIIKYYSPEPQKVDVVNSEEKQWTKKIVRDYRWVIKNWSNRGYEQ
ncbi:MAG: glycosyltransferase [Candidatus Aenigmarchaeota archaeon]|nr:glycosyltransferase [Candidatus Aenigmarchaeota archaeon]